MLMKILLLVKYEQKILTNYSNKIKGSSRSSNLRKCLDYYKV